MGTLKVALDSGGCYVPPLASPQAGSSRRFVLLCSAVMVAVPTRNRTVPWEQYLCLRETLDGMSYLRSIAKIEVSVEQVNFGDNNLMWIEGQMKKFHSPQGWIPVKQ
jgi:hypothetical protein